MKHCPWIGLGALAAVCWTAPPAAATDDHALLCEGAINGADFVEIGNPTDAPMPLRHHYLSDHAEYYRLPAAFSSPADPPPYASGDFVVRFPDDAEIPAGSSIVVVFDSAAFTLAYPDRDRPDFEVRRSSSNDDINVRDMEEAFPSSVAYNAGFTGDGEWVALFRWDPSAPGSDLVEDVDIVRLGKPKTAGNEIPDKSLQEVDGPDVGSTPTPYPPQAMTMDMPSGDPAEGKSIKRLLLEDGYEEPGGSGMSGDDETSEKIARTWDGSVFPYWAADPGCCMALNPECYYDGVRTADRADLREDLNNAVAGHKRYGWGETLWEILELAEADPYEDDGNDTVDFVLDIYKNAVLPRGAHDLYEREHSWPKSLGFPEATLDPHTDCHALFLAYADYNRARSNNAYADCESDCTAHETDENYGRGGTGVANYLSSGVQQMWETWPGRRGEVARAQFYMDVRYEGGVVGDPNLILTDDPAMIVPSGEGATEGYMGLLPDLVEWHLQDPVDDVERARHEMVFFYQKNRNPFVDHPEWVGCALAPPAEGLCAEPGDLADVSLVKTDGETEVAPGDLLTYTIDVANAGPAYASRAKVEDTLDETRLDLDNVSWSCARLAGTSPYTGCPPAGGAADLAAGVEVSVKAGESVRFTVQAPTLPGAAGTVVNTATVSAPSALVDPDGSDNAATDHTTFLVPGGCGAFDDRDLSGLVVTTVESFTACRSISAGDFLVTQPAGAVTLLAGERIELRDGFVVDEGCALVAEIDPTLAP